LAPWGRVDDEHVERMPLSQPVIGWLFSWPLLKLFTVGKKINLW
jgi:hypothetical protein